jgi:hypothetical protein
MSFALRTFPNSPFLAIAPTEWSSTGGWMEPMTAEPSTCGMVQARVDVIECPESFCVYFGLNLIVFSFSLPSP